MKREKMYFSFGILLTLLLLLIWRSSIHLPSVGKSELFGKTSPDTGASTILTADNGFILPIRGMNTNYVKLPDINPRKVPEIRLGFNTPKDRPFIIRETSDGFLFGSTLGLMTSAAVKYPKNTPWICKLDRNGQVIWDEKYNEAWFYTGRINNLLVFPDDSCVFSAQIYPFRDENKLTEEKSLIVRCDRNGRMLWKKEFNDEAGDLLRHLFLTEKGEILAVGQWFCRNKDVRGREEKDIVVTKLDQNGQVLEQKGFGGSDFDNLSFAQYDPALGILINARTSSKDGDFAIPQGRRYADFMACIAEDLDIKWVVHAGEQESFIYDRAAIDDRHLYILGQHIPKEGEIPGSGFILQIDKNGKRGWKNYLPAPGLWGRGITILQNGDLVIGVGQINQGSILIMNKNGQEKKRLDDLKYWPQELTPTKDGGFIVTAARVIKCIPQPAYISSIWFDMELVAAKYSRDGDIEWRKTYDSYKDSKDLDYVFPLSEGKIIVGNR